MKILILGSLIFFGWSAFSTHFYVCKIRKLCDSREVMQIAAANVKGVLVSDSLDRLPIRNPDADPGTMTINFAFDKSEFEPDVATDKYFEKSKNYMVLNITAKLSITGHTDAVGSDEYNLSLGFRRAQSLQDYFESKGIIKDKIIAASSGEKDPADENNTISGRANNRRTVITINK